MLVWLLKLLQLLPKFVPLPLELLDIFRILMLLDLVLKGGFDFAQGKSMFIIYTRFCSQTVEL